jgi:5'-methylthioadenosine phosphorylase
MTVKIGIIGGTGVYDPEAFEHVETVTMTTPYGDPSGDIEVGLINGIKVAFLPRHGKGHVFPPHNVPYRANIWALKHLGVERIVSPCAVGSLQEEYAPGEIVLVDQFIDLTKSRNYTFFDGPKTVHISCADPFCPELTDVFKDAAARKSIPIHVGGTYMCIEGPRFSTRAESKMYRNFADIIGMTLVPECQLAREMEMCYCSLATVTDYDVWAEETVDTAMILKTMAENIDKVRSLLEEALPKIASKQEACECARVLEEAGA